MKYGLGQTDLNLLARLALSGLSDTPERDIANLLRSGQPIEAETRNRLADALDGRRAGLQLKVQQSQRGAGFRAFALRRKRLRIGREAIALGQALGYTDANEQTAAKYRYSKETIAASVALARRIDEWVKRSRADGLAGAFSDFALELVYLYADATKQRPDDALKPSAEFLADMMREFDEFQIPALRGRRSGEQST